MLSATVGPARRAGYAATYRRDLTVLGIERNLRFERWSETTTVPCSVNQEEFLGV
jgi:hypothetical protein